MSPVFDPGPPPYGQPKVLLAGVGAHMTAVAAEVADGLICHPFHTVDYLRSVTLPVLDKGLATSGRARANFELSVPVMLVTGRDEQEVKDMRRRVRRTSGSTARRPPTARSSSSTGGASCRMKPEVS